jgi:hypothetical protein
MMSQWVGTVSEPECVGLMGRWNVSLNEDRWDEEEAGGCIVIDGGDFIFGIGE